MASNAPPRDEGHPYVIIVATDFSETGDRAFDHALALAHQPPETLRALGASCGLNLPFDHTDLHVVWVDDGYDPMGQVELVWQSDPSMVKKAVKRITEYARKRAHETGIEDREVDRIVCHARVGNAAQHIVQLATDLHAELVVIGTHGHTGLKRLLLGSVAEHVTRQAPCPVLIVRRLEHDKVPAAEKVEPACPDCIARRKKTNGEELWCKKHDERADRPYESLRGSDLAKRR